MTVDISTLDEIADLEGVCELFGRIWPSPDGHPPTTVGLLKALAHTENYVAGAFRGGHMLGAAVAFLGYRANRLTLFSNQIAVEPAEGGGGVGLALQQHMGQWALQHGIDEINWTFDPTIVRNAYFFINKVGARGIDYLPDFYGGSYDPGSDSSDRVFAVWDLTLADAGGSVISSAPIALSADSAGAPAIDGDALRSDRFAMRLPTDIKALRRTDARLADRWRQEVRLVLGSALNDGYRLVAVSRDGQYIIAR